MKSLAVTVAAAFTFYADDLSLLIFDHDIDLSLILIAVMVEGEPLINPIRKFTQFRKHEGFQNRAENTAIAGNAVRREMT